MLGFKAYKVQVKLVPLFLFSFSLLAQELPYKLHKALYEAGKLLDSGNSSGAEAVLKSYLREGRDHYLLEQMLGSIYLSSGKLGKAKDAFSKCVKLMENSTECWRGLGKVCYDLEKFEEAGRAFLKAYEFSKRPEDLYYSAVSFLVGNETAEAFKLLGKLVSSTRPKKEWLEAYIYAGVSLKRYREVINAVKRVLTETGDPKWWKVLGEVYLRSGMVKKGAGAFLVYSLVGNLTSEDWAFMGDLFSSLGLFEDASRFYIKAGMHKKAVEALIYGRMYKKATELSRKFYGSSGDPRFIYLGGKALFMDGDFEGAKKLLVEAKSKVGGCEISVLLARVFIALGDWKEARRELEEAAAHKKCRKEAKSLLKALGREGL